MPILNSKVNMPTSHNLDGYDALSRRDRMESFMTNNLPAPIRRWMSAGVTAIAGVAPTIHGGSPIWRGSELRALLYMIASLISGLLLILIGDDPWKLAGSMFAVSAMRNFSSSVGHHLTHSAKSLPWPIDWTRYGYDVLSALLLLPSYEGYRIPHRVHHAKVAGPEDPDQVFIEYLKAHIRSLFGFFATLLNPVLHLRFLTARFRAVFCSGPIWRRLLAFVSVAGSLFMPAHALAMWLIALIIGYQMASLTSFVSLHLWGNRPESTNPAEVSIAVTFGRLLIPEPSLKGVLLLPLYAIVRALWLQGDLNNHDLHHLGRGPWTEAAYVRTRLILNGVHVRQTNGVRAMFLAPFDAGGVKPTPHAHRQLNDEHFLNM